MYLSSLRYIHTSDCSWRRECCPIFPIQINHLFSYTALQLTVHAAFDSVKMFDIFHLLNAITIDGTVINLCMWLDRS
jgi:hypothetical protein